MAYNQAYNQAYAPAALPPAPPPPPNRFIGEFNSSPGYHHGRDLGSGYDQGYGYAGGVGNGYPSPCAQGQSFQDYGLRNESFQQSPFSGDTSPGAYNGVLQPPPPQHKEFFINVTLSEWMSHENAANAAKAQGRSKFGRAGSLLGGLVGSAAAVATQVTGAKVVPDSVIASEVTEAVTQCCQDIMRREGWNARVAPVSLPPMPGQEKWSNVVMLGDLGHFMVFRVQLLKPTQEGPLGHDEPPANTTHSSYKTGTMMQEALRTRAKPITSEIQIADGQHEYRILNERGWSHKYSYEAVMSARHSAMTDPSIHQAMVQRC